MKKLFLLFGIVFSLSFISSAYASCSLGATPLSVSAKAKPGNTVEVTWNLYNMYGDRNTHVTISISGQEEGWEFTIDPPLQTNKFNVAGVTQEVQENLYLTPKPAVDVYPAVIPQGQNYIKHPFKDAYIPVSVVKIYIKVPETVSPWENHKFTVTATGKCFGTETGTLSTQVSTSLDVNIQTVPESYYEELILVVPWYIEYLPVIVTLAVLIILLALLYFKPQMWKKLKTRKSKK